MIQNPDAVTIRTATNADCDRVIALVSGVLSEFNLPFDLESKDSDLQNLEQSYLRSGGIFEVLEDRDENLLGTYGLFRIDNETCELRKMYFVPEIRGLGWGRRVLERAVDHARRLGYQRIVLETISVLKDAIRLYTRFGFAPIEGAQVSARVDQAYMLSLAESDSSR
jgi:putative acetyltransferase